MRALGADIGSRTIKLVAVENGEIVDFRVAEATYDPIAECKRFMDGLQYDSLMATGYGRHLFEAHFEGPTITEITAYAVGAKAVYPECRTILDIGGQDTKAIALDENGRVIKFEMNDRCAAGTGRFLEVMANALGYPIEEFGKRALEAEKRITISSMCTVFSESEVVSLLAKGERREDIAMGLHSAITRRCAAMLKRVYKNTPIMFAGGVAYNPCMRVLLEEEFKQHIFVPHNPQIVGAYGAALLAL